VDCQEAVVEPAADVTVVVVTWQAADLIGECLASLAAQTHSHRTLVVDNASTDGTAALIAAEFPSVRVLSLATNTGFAGGVAAALPYVRTPYLALLNNDATADPEWLERSLALLSARTDVAAAAARMRLRDNPSLLNNAGVMLMRGGYGADRGLDQPDGPPFDVPAEVFGFSGGAAVLRMDTVRAAGGMPPEFFLYYEDTDLAWRLRLSGWRIWYEPAATVTHRHAASTDRRSPMFAFYNERNRLLMLLRCAPAGFVLRQIVRFVLTSASLVTRRLLRQRVPPEPVFQVTLRLRVLAAVLRMAPRALRQRVVIGRSAVIPRAAITAAWVGR
jgi:GT2 family glycosyltransferase